MSYIKLLMYGAGNIGRGFIGPIFSAGGYEVVFADINLKIINALNAQKSYTLKIMGKNSYELKINNVRGIDGGNEEMLISEIANCDIMAVSLGAKALEFVSPIIAKGFVRRMDKSGQALDILICENLKNSAEFLGKQIEKHLPDNLKNLSTAKLGLVEAAIGRMVPVMDVKAADADPLLVCVEEYDYLPVDGLAFRNNVPRLPQLVASPDFSFYEERKLYLHNMAHCICACLGLTFGDEYIWQAIENPAVRLIVQGAMCESASMLSVNHNLPFHHVYKHAEDLLYRFSNHALGDTCERVARDPMRKIAPDDRLVAPFKKCLALNIAPMNIAMGLAVMVHSLGLLPEQEKEVLFQTCRLSQREAELVIKMLNIIRSNTEPAAYITEIDACKKNLRGHVV